MRNRNNTSKTRRVALVSALVAGLLAPVAATAGVAHAATVTATPAKTEYFYAGTSKNIQGISVAGLEGKNVLASLSVPTTSGTLSLGVTTGLTLSFGYTSFKGSSLSFVGSQSAVNAALASLVFASSKTDTSGTTALKTMFTEAKDGLGFLPANQHFYRFVSYGRDFTGDKSAAAAVAAAAATKEFGLTGYLATVTSYDENNFVSSKIEGAQNVWIGGSDAESENTWKFADGPDKGTTIWTGCAQNSSTSPGTSPLYALWAPGEPNNYNSALNKAGTCTDGKTADVAPDKGEDCMVTNWDPTILAADPKPSKNVLAVGYWNDIPCEVATGSYSYNRIQGYVIEYGNSVNSSTFDNSVAVRDNILVRTVPTQQLAPAKKDLVSVVFNGLKKFAKNFKLSFTKPATKAAPAKKEICPNIGTRTRLSYTLTVNEPGRYSFYFTNKVGKRIPMECGSKIMDRVITAPISAPVLQLTKSNAAPKIDIYLKTSSVGSDAGYPLLNVILKRADGTLILVDQPNPPLPGGSNAAKGVYGVKPTK